MKPSWRRLTGLLIVMFALVLAVSACGGDDDDEAAATTEAATTEEAAGGDKSMEIVLGTKDFTEEFILGELYKQALEAKGFTVTLKSNIGSTEIIDKALTSGEINMYPEYTGTALTVVFGEEGSAASAEETYEQAKQRYEERGQTLLDMTPFSDSDAIAVLKTTADENGLAAVGDLKKLGGKLTLGGQPEFRTRAQGLVGLKTNYGLTEAKFVPFAGISPYEALDQGTVLAAAIFSTDPPLASGKYVVLEDTEAQFGFQNIAPVVDQELVDALGAEFTDTVNAVSAKLTEDAIIAMNSAVAIDQKEPAEVAGSFLEANGLV
ncbi:MAG: glycine betaine ABC transporter substrate-binding protein [Gaiellaceae bacterium]